MDLHLLGGQYLKIRTIGRGSFGQAILVRRHGDPERYVIKQINLASLSPKERLEAQKEIKVLKSLKHVNIIGYRESFIEGDMLNIVLDFADNGDLGQHIAKAKATNTHFPEDLVLYWFSQLASALHFVHSRNILHRDIKAQNVFLTKDNIIKLGDFGIAKVLSSTNDMASTVIGTPYYMSPELCEDQPYNMKSDVWALGCILYELTALHHAFDGNNMGALVLKILRGTYAPIPDTYSPELRQLVAAMLEPKPHRRASVLDVICTPVIQSHLAKFEKAERLASKRALGAATAIHQAQAAGNADSAAPAPASAPMPSPAPAPAPAGTPASTPGAVILASPPRGREKTPAASPSVPKSGPVLPRPSLPLSALADGNPRLPKPHAFSRVPGGLAVQINQAPKSDPQAHQAPPSAPTASRASRAAAEPRPQSSSPSPQRVAELPARRLTPPTIPVTVVAAAPAPAAAPPPPPPSVATPAPAAAPNSHQRFRVANLVQPSQEPLSMPQVVGVRLEPRSRDTKRPVERSPDAPPQPQSAVPVYQQHQHPHHSHAVPPVSVAAIRSSLHSVAVNAQPTSARPSRGPIPVMPPPLPPQSSHARHSVPGPTPPMSVHAPAPAPIPAPIPAPAPPASVVAAAPTPVPTPTAAASVAATAPAPTPAPDFQELLRRWREKEVERSNSAKQLLQLAESEDAATQAMASLPPPPPPPPPPPQVSSLPPPPSAEAAVPQPSPPSPRNELVLPDGATLHDVWGTEEFDDDDSTSASSSQDSFQGSSQSDEEPTEQEASHDASTTVAGTAASSSIDVDELSSSNEVFWLSVEAEIAKINMELETNPSSDHFFDIPPPRSPAVAPPPAANGPKRRAITPPPPPASMPPPPPPPPPAPASAGVGATFVSVTPDSDSDSAHSFDDAPGSSVSESSHSTHSFTDQGAVGIAPTGTTSSGYDTRAVTEYVGDDAGYGSEDASVHSGVSMSPTPSPDDAEDFSASFGSQDADGMPELGDADFAAMYASLAAQQAAQYQAQAQAQPPRRSQEAAAFASRQSTKLKLSTPDRSTTRRQYKEDLRREAELRALGLRKSAQLFKAEHAAKVREEQELKQEHARKARQAAKGPSERVSLRNRVKQYQEETGHPISTPSGAVVELHVPQGFESLAANLPPEIAVVVGPTGTPIKAPDAATRRRRRSRPEDVAREQLNSAAAHMQVASSLHSIRQASPRSMAAPPAPAAETPDTPVTNDHIARLKEECKRDIGTEKFQQVYLLLKRAYTQPSAESERQLQELTDSLGRGYVVIFKQVLHILSLEEQLS